VSSLYLLKSFFGCRTPEFQPLKSAMKNYEKSELKEISAPVSGDMSAEDFRRVGYEMIDWIADYFQNIEQFPVLSQVEPNWLKDNLPDSAPADGEDFREILSDIDKSSELSRAFFHFDERGGNFRRAFIGGVRPESDALAHVARVNRTRRSRYRLAAANDKFGRGFSGNYLRHGFSFDASRNRGGA
jgi:hypothetical protein